jgi:hypothetical protein
VIGSPLRHGAFKTFTVPFVADLSVTGGTLCPNSTCTGFVGASVPASWGMMLLGFAGLGFIGYRKGKAGAHR